jgi:hypothetical protein
MKVIRFNLIRLARATNAVAIAGLMLNAAGFFLIWRQLGLQVAAQQSQVSNSLTGLSYDVIAQIQSKPQLYEYFYTGKPLTDTDPNRVDVQLVSEMIANYCDNAVQQAPSMSNEVWESWRIYISAQFKLSPAFRDFVRLRHTWYSPTFVQFLEQAEKDCEALPTTPKY